MYRIVNEVINPVRVLKNKDGKDYKTKVFFHVGGKTGKKIRYIAPKMTPMEARLNGHTYNGILEVEIEIIVSHGDGDAITTSEVLKLVNIPTMLHSEYCILNNMSEIELSNVGESQHERGGYFIINGAEKIVLSQEDSAKNLIYTHVDNVKNSLVASINSAFASAMPERFDLIFNRDNNTINARIPYLKSEIPLILLFKALGVETEKEILQIICGVNPGQIGELLFEQLLPSIKDVNEIYTQEIALRALSILTKWPATKIEDNRWKGNLLYILNRRFLPHIASSDDYIQNLNKKSYFLGYMTRNLKGLGCHLI